MVSDAATSASPSVDPVAESRRFVCRRGGRDKYAHNSQTLERREASDDQEHDERDLRADQEDQGAR